MEAQRISSRATPFYKIGIMGFASLWLLIAVVTSAHSQPFSGFDLLLPIAGVGFVFATYLFVGRAMEVEFREDVFLVSTRSRTVAIPIGDVEDVGGSRFSNPERMWLDLRRPSEFGSRIHFLPPQRWFNLFSQHPLVAELRAVVDQGAALGRAPAEQANRWPLWQRIAVGAAGFLAFASVLIVLVTGALKSSDPYQRAVSAVQTSPGAQQELGPPIDPGWFVTGSLQTSSEHGSATMEFTVSGARSNGTVRLSAAREAGAWVFTLLELHTGDGFIDLLNE
jgi:hypothetical protein